jgi:hypothetical protein
VVKISTAQYEGKEDVWQKNRAPMMRARSCINQFPLDVYEALALIAEQKKVSLAWVVREAAEKYIADKAPSFVMPGH